MHLRSIARLTRAILQPLHLPRASFPSLFPHVKQASFFLFLPCTFRGPAVLVWEFGIRIINKRQQGTKKEERGITIRWDQSSRSSVLVVNERLLSLFLPSDYSRGFFVAQDNSIQTTNRRPLF